MDYTKLPDLILMKPDVQDAIAEVVDEVKSTPGMSGERMYATLVYSGVHLGVEEASRYVNSDLGESVKFLSDMGKKLDDIIPLVDDTVLKTVSELRAQIAKTLEQRAKVLRGIHVGQAANHFGVSEDILMNDTPPEDLPPSTLQWIGMQASRASQANFIAWSQLTRFDRLQALKCKCTACMLEKVTPGTEETDELKQIIQHFGSMEPMFEEYAIFILRELRDNFASIIKGEGEIHKKDSNTAASTTKDFIKGMMGAARRRDD